MKPAKILIIFTFLLALAFHVSAQKSNNNRVKISAKDKSEILKQVFDDSFEKLMGSSGFNQCLTPIVNEKKLIFLMSDIDESFLRAGFKQYSFMLRSFSQISDEVKKNNGECYFKFNDFQIVNSKVRVNISRIVDEIHHFQTTTKYTRWIYGEGYSYEFEKANKVWRIVSTKTFKISS